MIFHPICVTKNTHLYSTFSHKAGLVLAEGVQEVRSDMGGRGVQWSVKDTVADALLAITARQT